MNERYYTCNKQQLIYHLSLSSPRPMIEITPFTTAGRSPPRKASSKAINLRQIPEVQVAVLENQARFLDLVLLTEFAKMFIRVSGDEAAYSFEVCTLSFIGLGY